MRTKALPALFLPHFLLNPFLFLHKSRTHTHRLGGYAGAHARGGRGKEAGGRERPPLAADQTSVEIHQGPREGDRED